MIEACRQLDFVDESVLFRFELGETRLHLCRSRIVD